MSFSPLIIDLTGLSLSASEKELITHPLVSGLVLFKRNYSNKKQLSDLIKSIRKLKENIFITVDHEGGRIQRFIDGFTKIPPMGELGKIYDNDPVTAINLANQYGRTIADELKAISIDATYAPVLDLGGTNTSVIGDRAFHSDAEVIIKLAASFIEGLHASGLLAIGKHFPGHGSVLEDSHFKLPKDKRSFVEISQNDILPFQKLHNNLDGIMLAHIIFEDVCEMPVTFSSIWIKEILRKKLGFKGTIFSDCLSMQATQLYGTIPERAKKALDAGCNKILICNDRSGAEETINVLCK